MKMTHMHAQVKDLESAERWFRDVMMATPSFVNDRMASYALGIFTLILDKADADSVATIAFATDDCDGDFNKLVDRGAVPLEKPVDLAWGARAAYLQGPGGLTIELEEML